MLKQRLGEGRPIFGTFVKVPAPAVVEVLALAGFEFIIVDQEHGTLSHTEAELLVRTAQGAGMEAVVRVPDSSRSSILHALDIGSAGVLVPMIESGAAAVQAVQEAHYPPAGRRGIALAHRASKFGFVPAQQYLQESAERTLVALQIETVTGVAAAEAIAATAGVDILFTGPTDLSLSLGVLGQKGHPKLVEACQTVYDAAARHGKATGTLVGTPAEAEAALKAGLRFIVWGSELALLGKAAREARAAWSGLIGT